MHKHLFHRAALWALAILIALSTAALAASGLKRTNDRADYPHLTDAQFANFRNVATTGMGANALYRSSSPINTVLGRNREADAAARAAGVRTVLNLADSKKKMRRQEGYDGSYYSTLDVVALGLSTDLKSKRFHTGLAEGFRFMADHEGPYLVHCTEGRTRAGFASAVLSCLMGASAEEVVADYMVTYSNYFGIAPGTDRYDAIAKDNIVPSLCLVFGVDDLFAPTVDLSACAENYMRIIGLTDEEIRALKARLEKDYS